MNKYLIYTALGLLIASVLATPGALADVALSEEIEVEYYAEPLNSGTYEDMDFAKLQINPRHSRMQIKPGSSDEITVTVTNKDNKTITAEPRIVISPKSENFMDEKWATITPSSKNMGPDEKQEFTVKLNIPEDADIGYYGAEIAFTDDMMPTPYPEYFNALHLSVDVWTPPKIQVQTPYIHDRVEAGEEYDYEIKLKNTADEDIIIDPKMSDNDQHHYGPYQMLSPAFDNDAISISAPSVVKAGETAVVNIDLKVPDDSKGRYDGEIDLGIDDPSIREWEGRLHMNFEVWTQPTTPYKKVFTTRTNETINIEVSSNQYNFDKWMGADKQNKKEGPSFELKLEGENGEVKMELVRTTYSGMVSLGISDFPPWEIDSSGIYQDSLTNYVETYEAEGAVGEWTVNILPKNTEQFEYRIAIGDTE